MKLTYHDENGYLIPDLIAPESPAVGPCNRRWAAAADAVTNGRPAVVAAGQFNRSLSA